MSKIIELREKRAKAWEGAKAFLDSKRGENGIVPPEAAAEYERMEAEMVALGKEIERLERQGAFDREFAKATSEPIVNRPDKNGEPDEPGKGPRATREYRNAFWNVLRGRGDMPAVQNSLKLGTDSDGGYLVPEEYERTLIQALEEANVIRRIAKVVTTGSDRKIPIVASKGTASWVDEEGAIPESDDAFGQYCLNAFKVATMIKVSEELLADSVFDIESYIARSFASRIGAKEEEAFVSGDGKGKPTGIFAASGGAQLGVTAASSTLITLDELMDLFYSLKSPYRRNASFLMNDGTVKAIRKLKDANGNYLWQPSVREAAPDTILGRPLITSSFVPEIGAGKKAIAFGDYSYYWIADREGRVFKKLVELYASTGQVGFLATQRVDAKLILPEAVKVLQMKGA